MCEYALFGSIIFGILVLIPCAGILWIALIKEIKGARK